MHMPFFENITEVLYTREFMRPMFGKVRQFTAGLGDATQVLFQLYSSRKETEEDRLSLWYPNRQRKIEM